MNYDNPAARLYNIIQSGTKLERAIPCYQAWSQLLDAPASDSITLFNRLGKMMSLPNECSQIIQLQYPMLISTIDTWKPPIEQAFFNQVLSGKWETFIQYIQPYVISQLATLAELVHANSRQLVAEDASVEQALQGLSTLIEEIESGDMLTEIKLYLIKELSALRMSLSEYKITGSFPAIRQAEAIVGHAHRDKKFMEFLTSHALGQRILDNLNVVVGVLNIYVATAQISTPGFALLGG